MVTAPCWQAPSPHARRRPRQIDWQPRQLCRQPRPEGLPTALCAPLQARSRAAAAAHESLEAEVFSLQESLAAQAASHNEEAAELRKQLAELREIIDSSLHSRRAATLKLDTTMHALNMSKGEAQQFLQVGGGVTGACKQVLGLQPEHVGRCSGCPEAGQRRVKADLTAVGASEKHRFNWFMCRLMAASGPPCISGAREARGCAETG